MVGLHYLKHVCDLSDEEVVERWVENSYHRYFCGFEFFQHSMPIDPSLMTRWRKPIGPDTLEEISKATVAIALETEMVKPSSLERVTVDTTVQSKAIAHPTDSRLYLKALLTLVGQAKKAEAMTGVPIERFYTDKGYRGHDYDGDAKVMLSGNKRGLTPTMKRELKQRSAVEPMIGHAKNDGRLGRNYLLGVAGDKINAILAAVGHMIAVMTGICPATNAPAASTNIW
jgi:hypothetical protein